MSVLLTAGRKAMQAKLAAQKLKQKRRSSARAGSARERGPPVSTSKTAVWYWLLNGVPTTIMLDKLTHQVWCNGYILEARTMSWQGLDFDDVLLFGIYLDELEAIHDGRICCLPGPDPINHEYVLYVDGVLVPEHTQPGVSADIVSIQGDVPMTYGCPTLGAPPQYSESVFGPGAFIVEPHTEEKKSLKIYAKLKCHMKFT